MTIMMPTLKRVRQDTISGSYWAELQNQIRPPGHGSYRQPRNSDDRAAGNSNVCLSRRGAEAQRESEIQGGQIGTARRGHLICFTSASSAALCVRMHLNSIQYLPHAEERKARRGNA